MNFLDLDFIEIGTSDFDTLIESANENTKGLSVEPLKYYLDKLPNKKNVKKINCAIAFDDIEKECTIYYLPENIIQENKLQYWFKGCNSINDYHQAHKIFKVEHLVQTITTKQIPISKLLIENNVRKIKHLKIDTEGGDCDILFNLKNYLQDKSNDFYPNMITFETNELTNKQKLKNVIEIYNKIGYIIKKIDESNTILIKQVDKQQKL